jgi:hypothetical protein
MNTPCCNVYVTRHFDTAQKARKTLMVQVSKAAGDKAAGVSGDTRPPTHDASVRFTAALSRKLTAGRKLTPQILNFRLEIVTTM